MLHWDLMNRGKAVFIFFYNICGSKKIYYIEISKKQVLAESIDYWMVLKELFLCKKNTRVDVIKSIVSSPPVRFIT